MNFERFLIYELHGDIKLPFQYVLCLTSTATGFIHPVSTVSFLPIVDPKPHSDHDPYRVPIPKGTTRLTSRKYVAIDVIQSISKAVFLPAHLGRVSAATEKEVKEKLAAWLDL